MIASARRGDAGAFSELVRRYQESAFRTAYLILRDGADAEDAAQEATWRAYRAIRSFREGSSFRPWLLKIVANQALTIAKSRQRRLKLAQQTAISAGLPGAGIDEAIFDRERADLIYRALDALNEGERVVVYLRYFLQLPERELAEYLGCAQGTVKSRLHRALARLRAIIARDYPQLMKEVV